MTPGTRFEASPETLTELARRANGFCCRCGAAGVPTVDVHTPDGHTESWCELCVEGDIADTPTARVTERACEAPWVVFATSVGLLLLVALGLVLGWWQP